MYLNYYKSKCSRNVLCTHEKRVYKNINFHMYFLFNILIREHVIHIYIYTYNYTKHEYMILYSLDLCAGV